MVQLIKRLVLLALVLCLTGCVDYDLGIQFDSQTHGTLTQTLHLSEQVTQLNPDKARQWLRQFDQRARLQGGKVKTVDARTVQVTVPFNNGTDLSETYNALFDTEENPALSQLPGSPQLTSHLELRQKNRVLALRNQLALDIDLTSLPGPSTNRQDWRVLNLAFHLVTPWGVVSQVGGVGRGREVVWPLQPGQITHIEADFWVPSPIGIGAGAIAILMALGYLIKRGLG
ncbi:MAG: DUF3153 domain-containing protein [Cyanobacteria bacterium J06632_22]